MVNNFRRNNMRIKSILVIMSTLFLIVGCGDNRGSSSREEFARPISETLAQTEVLNIDDNVSVGKKVGKVNIPTKMDDTVNKVELVGVNSDKFLISKDGIITTKTSLKKQSKISNMLLQKRVRSEKTYSFQIKVTYKSGKIIYINIKIIIVSSTDVDSDTTPPTKASLTTMPTTTTSNIQSVEVNGEVNATVWVNGIKVGAIGSNGKVTIKLDTSGVDGTKHFSIILKDTSGNASEALVVDITKTTAVIPDTTPPIKATLTTTPTTTRDETQNIEVNGEVGATVWLDGVNIGTIGADGKLIVALDTSGEDSNKSFSIILKDTSGNRSEALIVNIEKITNITYALKRGDADEASIEEIYKAIEDTYAKQLNECVNILNKIYPNGLKAKADVDITQLSKVTTKSFGWIPLITAYNGGDSETYFYMKEFPNGTRVVIGSMPLFNEVNMKGNYDDGVDKSEVLNILKWLAGSKGSDANGNFKSDKDFLNSTIKIMWNDAVSGWSYGGGWNHLWDVNSWIGANFSGVSGVTLQEDGLPQNWLRTKNNSLPTDSSYDIYMATTPNDTFVQTVLDHANSGEAKGFFIVVPPLNYYNAHNSITGTEAHWGTYNQKAYGDAPSIEAQCRASIEGGLAQLVSDLKTENFHYEFPQINGGRGQNDRWDIPLSNGKQVRDYTDTVDGQTLNNKLFKKLDSLIESIRFFDYKKTDIFADKSNNRLHKLLILLGDKYRENISYPMDKVDTDNTTFFKALYADNSISYFRKGNTYQPKMGTFLNHDNDANRYADNKTLNAKTTTNKSKSFQTTKFSEPTTMGVYAPPGKEIVIKRTDSEQGVKVWIAINFTRGGIGANNSMPFTAKNLYNRPQTVSSHWIEIDTGEEIRLSTPYGGPIYVWWDAQTSAIKPIISFDIENILEHPVLYLDGSESEAQKAQEIADFSTALSQNDNFSWAEIKTPFAELHSLMGNLMSVINNSTYSGDVGKYVEYMNKYLILGTYHWAGFNGGGLAGLNPSVTDFCTEHNLDCTNSVIHQKPKIQHINSDAHALCGNACAGNPIDFDYGVDPLAQLPNHEMGHNLQVARMKLPNGGEVSNLIVPMHTSRTFALDNGKDNFSGWDQLILDFNTSFTVLKTELMNNNTLVTDKGPGHEKMRGMAFYAQLLWSSSSDENVSWDFYTKMWLHDRIFADAISDAKNPNDDSYWESKRDDLGFSNYSRAEAIAVNSIDYMSIVSSLITKKDYTDFFEMWLLKVSDKAKNQISYTTKQQKAYLCIDQTSRSNLEGDVVNGDTYGNSWWMWWVNPPRPYAWPVHAPTTWIDMSNPSTAEYNCSYIY